MLGKTLPIGSLIIFSPYFNLSHSQKLYLFSISSCNSFLLSYAFQHHWCFHPRDVGQNPFCVLLDIGLVYQQWWIHPLCSISTIFRFVLSAICIPVHATSSNLRRYYILWCKVYAIINNNHSLNTHLYIHELKCSGNWCVRMIESSFQLPSLGCIHVLYLFCHRQNLSSHAVV